MKLSPPSLEDLGRLVLLGLTVKNSGKLSGYLYTAHAMLSVPSHYKMDIYFPYRKPKTPG